MSASLAFILEHCAEFSHSRAESLYLIQNSVPMGA